MSLSAAVRHLRDYVAIPSVNPMGRDATGGPYLEYRVTDYLEGVFHGLGVAVERTTVAPMRDNIVARYDAGAATTILMEVHQDTVPVEGMTVEPFGGEIRDGRLYGRGACDVKGGMAAMVTGCWPMPR